jgi:murein DD-endopeptidase MepM/ murein hydrolase activator NlpD
LGAGIAGSLALPGLAAAQEGPNPVRPFVIHLPGLGKDGPPLSLAVSQFSVYQGGAFLVRANYRPPVTATFLGRQFILSDDITGSVGYVGVDTEATPGTATLTVTATRPDSSQLYTQRPMTVLATQWTVDYIYVDPTPGQPGEILTNPELIAAELVRLQGIYAGQIPRLWTAGWQMPIPGAPVTAYFGEQRSFNGGPVGGHHGGSDLGAEAGTLVQCANRGVVVLAEELYVRGNMVIVDHGGGVYTGYAHLSAINVEAGQPVSKGTVLGAVGSTGLATGPHLHWEMAVGGVLVDALRWTDGSQGF